jgi:hypothetical protein
MKKTFLKIVALFAVVAATTSSVSAQGSFAYQAVIRDAKGDLVSDADVNMKFSLSEKDKPAVYVETQKAKTNKFGNISVMVGSGSVVDGNFNEVPWHTMAVWMKVEVDVKGGNNFVTVGEIQLQAVPYANYAASAGSLVQENGGDPKAPIFSVKDDEGNLVFAVYNDGVKVYVDDTDASKAVRTGFAVSGRKAAKDGETNDYFVVNGKGTQVYVDEDTTSGKAVRTGFAVSGRKAAKDGSANLFTVNSDGTQVFIDDDSAKAVRTGFAVSGRKAAKDGSVDDYLTINTSNGTQVFIDDDSTKAVRTGFAVSGRKAAKDGVADDYFTIDTEGTKVYVDEDEEDPKAVRTGFAVSGRKAAKDGSANLFTVNGKGTQVFIDDDSTKAVRTGFAVSGRKAAKDETDDFFTINTVEGTQVFVDEDSEKAVRTGFAVSGRKAAKDGEPELLLKVDGSGTQVFIDDTKAVRTGFAVSGRKAAKDSVESIDYLYINGDTTQFKSSSFLVKEKDSDVNLLSMSNSSTNFKSSSFSVSEKGSEGNLLAVENGNVHINSDMLMSGEVEKKADIKMSSEQANKEVRLVATQSEYTISTDKLFTDDEEFSLLKIVGESAAVVQSGVLAFNADGSIAKNENDAVVRISLNNNVLLGSVNYDKVGQDGVVVIFGVQNGLTEGKKVVVTFKK